MKMLKMKNLRTQQRVKCKLKKGDQVVAIAGDDKGQKGQILSVVGERIVVQGLNLKKKHVKPNQQMQKGGIIEIERPIHVSNLKRCSE
jgi:large subunit ribosomal protein L24